MLAVHVCMSRMSAATQEIAVMSGLAAAERLGADYPFSHDALAAAQVGWLLISMYGT